MNIICCSDFHLRGDTPISRNNLTFLKIQLETIEFIFEKAKEYKAMVLIAGDIFHRPTDNINLLKTILIEKMIDIKTHIVSGNHDLFHHSNLNLQDTNYGMVKKILDKLSDYTLIKQNDLGHKNDDFKISFFNYYDEIMNDNSTVKLKIALLHKFCNRPNTKDRFNSTDCDYFFDNYNYDIFIIGDNHDGFIKKKNGRLIINSGCITRQSKKYNDYNPFVTLLNTEDLSTKKIYLPDCIEELTNNTKESDESGVEIIERDYKIDNEYTFDFQKNIMDYIRENKISEKIKNKTEEIMIRARELKDNERY